MNQASNDSSLVSSLSPHRDRWGRLLLVFVGAALSAPLLGCTMSVDEACDKYMAARKAEGKSTDGRDTCVEKLSDLKERSSKSWGCVSGCYEKNDDFKSLDSCPWSCDNQYGNDGKRLSSSEQLESLERWQNGILGDGGEAADDAAAEAAFKKGIEDEATAKARALEKCIPVCKAQSKPGQHDYSKCMDACQAKAK